MSDPNVQRLTPATIQTTISEQGGQIIKEITYQSTNLHIHQNTTFQLFDENEQGQLMGFEIHTDLPAVILQMITYGDNATYPNYINNLTMEGLLQLGRGLTPGEVQILPNLTSQDIQGTPSPIYPYLARYKLDTQPDFTGSTSPSIVLRFEPNVYKSYKRIIANVINTSLDSEANIFALDIKRLIFVNLGPGEANPDITQLGTSTFQRTVALPTPGVARYGWPAKKKQDEHEPLTYE